MGQKWQNSVHVVVECPLMNTKGMVFIEVPTKLGHIFTEDPFSVLGTMVKKKLSKRITITDPYVYRNPKEFLTLTIFFLKRNLFYLLQANHVQNFREMVTHPQQLRLRWELEAVSNHLHASF